MLCVLISFLLLLYFINIVKDIVASIGNIAAIISPILNPNCSGAIFNVESVDAMLVDAKSVIAPVIAGPAAAPRSPAAASKANIDAPAKGNFSDATTNIPGHNKLTKIPHTAQATIYNELYGEIATII